MRSPITSPLFSNLIGTLLISFMSNKTLKTPNFSHLTIYDPSTNARLLASSDVIEEPSFCASMNPVNGSTIDNAIDSIRSTNCRFLNWRFDEDLLATCWMEI